MDKAGLLTMLEGHQPADARESEFRRRMVTLVRDSAAPFSRHQTQPGHITASAFVLSPDGADLLLIHHAKLGLWLQPGGHVDEEDTDIFAAARREVSEETAVSDVLVEPGFPALLDVDIHAIPANLKKGEGPHEHFDVRVLLRARTRQITAGSDALAARWVPLAQVGDAGTDDSVRRAVRKLMAG